MNVPLLNFLDKQTYNKIFCISYILVSHLFPKNITELVFQPLQHGVFVRLIVFMWLELNFNDFYLHNSIYKF